MNLTATSVWTGRGARDWFVGPQTRSAVRPLAGARRLGIPRIGVLAFAFLLPVVALPGLEHPFSRPKLLLWTLAVLVGLIASARRLAAAWRSMPRGIQIALAAWLGALGVSASGGDFASLESLLLPLLGAGWLAVLLAIRPRAEDLAWMLVLSGSVVAMVALAQFLGADPFAFMGWISAKSTGPRMRVFATLGNPDFVAAFLAGLLPLTLSLACRSRARRALLVSLCGLQSLAILATGSRAPILALAAASLWMMRFRAARRLAYVLGLIVAAIVSLGAVRSTTRDLTTTVRGRIYVWKVVAPHIAEHPLIGLGPGGFGAAYSAWETQYWSQATNARDRAFAGIEDHAHNDFLEILADYGAAGLIVFLVLLAVFLQSAWRAAATGRAPMVAGAAAGVSALAAMALVDFPLMRPTESFLFWSLMAICLVGLSGRDTSRRRDSVSSTNLKGD